MSEKYIPFQVQLNHAVEAILAGESIIYPTETLWGLGCDATSDEAVRKLFKIKRRNLQKKVITMIAEDKDIFTYVSNPPPDILDIIQNFDRPTSMIFEEVVGLSELVMDDGAAAIRIAKTPFDKALIKQSGKPIVTTSANYSGNPSPSSLADIPASLIEQVAYAVGPFENPSSMTGTPSDIVKISKDGSYQYIRS